MVCDLRNEDRKTVASSLLPSYTLGVLGTFFGKLLQFKKISKYLDVMVQVFQLLKYHQKRKKTKKKVALFLLRIHIPPTPLPLSPSRNTT